MRRVNKLRLTFALVPMLTVPGAVSLLDGCSDDPAVEAGDSATGPDTSKGDSASSDAGTPADATLKDASDVWAPPPLSDAGPMPSDASAMIPDVVLPPADPCLSIAPGVNPVQHRDTILNCLTTKKRAVLLPGIHTISNLIQVPAGAVLEGTGGKPTLRYGAAAGNSMVTLFDGSVLRSLRLQPGGFLDQTNGAIVHIEGSNAVVKDCVLENVSVFSKTTGVYFIGKDKKDSVVEDTEIKDSFYGVIFASYLDAAHPNIVRRTKIHAIACDGVTLAGYGEVRDSEIFDVGFNCLNPAVNGGPPIPGAAIFSLGNPNGGLLAGNNLHEACGNVIDVDRISGLKIQNNTITGPSYQRSAFETFCVGGASVSIVDSSNLVITGNNVVNERATSRVGAFGDPNFIFGRYGDLPQGSNQAIAFWLTRRVGGPPATGSTIDNNVLRANCAAPCVGLGYFIGRRTGVDAQGNWSAATTNYFTRNNPVGSNVGSKRCGRNWYAGNSVCGNDAECNLDDAQHPDTAGFRNDNCP
ncbi:MAG: hypothetical protein KBF88_08590 [Polyangiaceae bacterium]|nr:hypothetical protein [Polyangiaceae bacterium]